MRRPLAVLALLATSGVAVGGLTVRVAAPGDRVYVRDVTAAWTTARSDLDALGLALPPVTIRAAKDANDFARTTGEAWFVAAVTKGPVVHTQRLGALDAKGTLTVTIRHELFHAAQPSTLPRWLAEGLARTFSGESRGDPAAKTGLESVSNDALDRLLAERRDERTLKAAYVEATRRAARQVHERGWRGALRIGRP